MVELWSAFLSCDARDMCRVGPALIRNHLCILAVAIRFFSLWLLLLPGAWFLPLLSDVYWVSRQESPDYLTFESIRDEANRARDASARRDLSNQQARETARALVDRMREWEERTNPEIGLFFWDEVFQAGRECSPFFVYRERFALLERQEPAHDGDFFCEYLVFKF